jgi:short-subunit dehydrogenase
MKALVTGASSGIGRDIALYLDELGYEVILVARNKDKLDEVSSMMKNKNRVIICDLSKEENCHKLYEDTKGDNIDLLVNNAGFGVFGNFVDTSLEDEVNMVKVNDIAPHILTKLFLKDFVKRDSGRILNVCSSAAFYSGPLMATYYASKGYIYKLTQAIYEELKKMKSNVHITALCPGPVSTNFRTTRKTS